MDAKIIVATHKQYQMPSDELYLPIQVGAEGKEKLNYIGDNTSHNISKKNANYCELTGLYWAWKNLNCNYIGLAHYRRHFCLKKKGNKFNSILTSRELETLLKNTNVILPKRRNYYIETVYNHYSHTFHCEDLDMTRDIIAEKYPYYIKYFDKVMQGKKIHIFNMFIMKKEILNEYCNWLFDILFTLEERLDISKYSSFEARVFGRVSELLLDVWLLANDIKFTEIPVIYM